jgi:serine/threonine-protein kinase
MNDDVAFLFREVADLSRAERASYFERHQTPRELRAEVESLLGFDSAGGAFDTLVSSAARDLLASRENSGEGSRLGPYRLVRLLGRGGAGEVYLAERADGQVEQRVAIKLLRHDSAGRVFVDRFLRERQILASLQHAGIARLLDAGQTASGKPYLVMDYVDGAPIDVYAGNLDLCGKLNLFLLVCDAVACAHRSLIIHRDLKPSNILVNAAGEPKLLDFGIAKILTTARDETRTQDRMLTPSYASPEQMRGEAQTTATDVYSLGAVLYDLLTGHSPHESSANTAEAAAATIRESDPPPASTLNPELPRDIDFILRKALRKEPRERYVSVESMAGDIRAFLEWRPIHARSGNAWYRARKFVRRYYAVVAAAALTIAGLSAGLYVANRQRAMAQQRFQQLHQLSTKVFNLDSDIRSLPGATQARHRLVSASLEYLDGLGKAAHGDLDLAAEIGEAYRQVARIQGVPTGLNLGEFASAEQNLKKADGLIDSVLAARPKSAPALIASAGIAHDRMILAHSERRAAEAKSHAGKAVERLDRLTRAGGLTAPQREDAAQYFSNVALFHMNVHLYADAVRYANRSIEIARPLQSANANRAKNLSLIGNCLRCQGYLDEALQALRAAREIARGPIFSNPTDRALSLYGILLREARTLGQDGISLGRTDEAIAIYQEAVDLTEEAAARDSRDQTSRARLATCARELAELLLDRNPRRSLATFDLAISRQRDIKNNLAARRAEAQLLAESSYALRRLRQAPESRRRIDAAFALLRETRDYPAQKIGVESEVAGALRAQAAYESDVGDHRRAVQIYEQLFAGMIASSPDSLGDLIDAYRISMMYYSMASAYRRAGDPAKAGEMDALRLQLWRKWDEKLPRNSYVQRQLAMRSE